MSWLQILIAVALPTAVGLIAAWPFWRWKQIIIGNTVGAGVAFALTIGLIGISFVQQAPKSWQAATHE